MVTRDFYTVQVNTDQRLLIVLQLCMLMCENWFMNRLHLRLTSDSGVKTGFFFTPRPNMGEIQNKSTIKRSGLVSLKHCLYFKKKKKKK